MPHLRKGSATGAIVSLTRSFSPGLALRGIRVSATLGSDVQPGHAGEIDG